MNNIHSNISIKRARLALDTLSIFRGLLKDELICSLYQLLQMSDGSNFDLYKALRLYNEFFYRLACSGISLQNYILDKLIFDENPFSRESEKSPFGEMDSFITLAAAGDLDKLQLLSSLSGIEIKEHILSSLNIDGIEFEMAKQLPVWSPRDSLILNREECIPIKKELLSSERWSSVVKSLSEYYYEHGCSYFAKYRAFLWDDSQNLTGIATPDPVVMSDLIGYESERSEIIQNTLNFLDGYPSNNILLYGDKGTGKSSTVKAILNEYHSRGLRMIEVPKRRLIDFPRIVRLLKDRKQKFIIFVDDLAFEDNEENYTALKAALEGGLESKPSNVLIYATSNRRHLIKEKFSDRAGLSSGNAEDEVRAYDNLQEKLSLADRFGITVVFSSPDKKKFLEIVEGISSKRGIEIDKETLHKEALKWEMWYNGRSPRTARQFVDWLEGKVKS